MMLHVLVWLGMIFATAWSPDACAESTTAEPFMRPKIDTKQPPETRFRLTPHWNFGAEIELDVEKIRDFDLDSREDDDTTLADPKFQLAFSYRSGDWLSAFFDFEVGKEFLVESPEGQSSRSSRLEIVQSWLEVEGFDGTMRLRLGRQDFEDERTWLFDEELDGPRLYLEAADARLELSATRRNRFSRDVLNSTEKERINNYLALVRFGGKEDEDNETNLYTFYRDGRRRDEEDLLFTGVQSYGEMSDEVDYWLNVSGVVGDAQGNSIRAYGFDAGMIYALERNFEPSLTLGLAFGSGDSNPDGRDLNFRQTGLHDNDAELSGETDIKYYGHALDPELSNLWVATIGLGVKPTSRSSIELIYHYYRQDEALDELRDSNLEVDPDGEHKGLGQALDLVYGYVRGNKLEVEIVAGWFFPGSAFENDASSAFFGGFEVVYQF